MSAKNLQKQLIGAAAMVTEMAILTIAGGFAGEWLDKQLQTSPLLLFVGILAGFLLGMYRLYTTLKRLDPPPPSQ